jgi:hypothetical protein
MPLDMQRALCGACGQAVYRVGQDSPWLTLFARPGETAACQAVADGRHLPCPQGHKPGEHDASCMPPADPDNADLRLLRAIYGLCPLCDRTDQHGHPYGPPPGRPG